MTTMAVALGENCLHTYIGEGLEKVTTTAFPKAIFDSTLTYATQYAQAEAFIATVLAGATKLICSNADGFGIRNEAGETVVPKPPAEVKGFVTVGQDILASLIVGAVNKKSTTVPSILLKAADTKYYCLRCGTLNSGMVTAGLGETRTMTDCKHRVLKGAGTAFAMWHTLSPTIP